MICSALTPPLVVTVLILANEPEPLPDHKPVVEPTVTEPLMATVALFAHTDTSGPIATIGEPVNVIKTESITGLQLPLLVDVKIKFAKPAVNSAALGVYVAVNTELFALYVPEPPDQLPVVVVPDTTPASAVIGLFLHEVKFTPAFTNGELVKLIKTLSFVW